MKKLKSLFARYGHFGFLFFALGNYLLGNKGLSSTMICLFVIEELFMNPFFSKYDDDKKS